jgi:SAM-dependent methyltransferase
LARERPEGFETRWRRRFEEFATDRDDDAGVAGWSETGLAARLRHFKRLWTPGLGGSLWLDAGCGAGTYSRYLSERGMSVIGVDYSEPALRKASERGGALGWIIADVRHLPFTAGAFDGILCFGVTQALSESTPAVRELASAVRPGGHVWIDALNAVCIPHTMARLWRRWRGRSMHLRYESPRRLREMMRVDGFTDVTLHWLPILPERLQRLQWVVETRLTTWLLRNVPFLGALLSHAFVVHGHRARTP